jgi:hypothetical protein
MLPRKFPIQLNSISCMLPVSKYLSVQLVEELRISVLPDLRRYGDDPEP